MSSPSHKDLLSTNNRLHIEKIVAGGYGLARTDRGVALIAGALPGETVEARLEAKKGRFEGRVTRVLEASDQRVQVAEDVPPTADLAHATYAAQLEYKRAFVLESLERIARLEADVLPTHPSPQQWRYRNGAQYVVTGAGVGYRQPGTHRAQLITADALTTELISDGLADLNPELLEPANEIAFRASLETNEVLACLIGLGKAREYYGARKHLEELGVTGVSFAFATLEGRFRAGVTPLFGAQTVLERYGDVQLSVSASGFAQVNPAATGELYRAAVKLAGTGGACVDLYGGSGGLAFHLAQDYERVTVVEINEDAVDRGEADAQRMGQERVQFQRGDAGQITALSADLISVDPPRAGLSPEALEVVLRANAERVMYLSCDPATWARDAARFVKAGYRLTHVQPWDFYPQTSHVEVLSLLER
jgi:tRNA (uracil-5-)-methyltransferase/23S rRNA (uracil1939-C5)-methyltransferase